MKNQKDVKRIVAEMEEIVHGFVKDVDALEGGNAMRQLEEGVEEAGRQMMCALLRAAVRRWQRTHPIEAKRCACGMDENKGPRDKDIQTRWGTIPVTRLYRRCAGCGHSDFAGDGELGIEADGISPGLRETVTLLGTLLVFEDAAKVLHELFGLTLSAKQVQRITEKVGDDVVKLEEEDRPVACATEDPHEGEWHFMVDANTVHTYSGWKNVRNAVFRTPDGGTVRYVADLIDYATFGDKLRRYAASLGIRDTRKVVAVADGLEANWKLIRVNFPGARQILDFYHAAEHIWQAGRVVYGEGTAPCRDWCEEHCRGLKEEGPDGLLDELSRRIPRQKVPENAKALEDLQRYIQANRKRMDYPRYVSDGHPIGSGHVESACKGVTGARLKGPGMRWRVDNVRRMAHLRAIYKSGLWTQLWQQRTTAFAA